MVSCTVFVLSHRTIGWSTRAKKVAEGEDEVEKEEEWESEENLTTTTLTVGKKNMLPVNFTIDHPSKMSKKSQRNNMLPVNFTIDQQSKI